MTSGTQNGNVKWWHLLTALGIIMSVIVPLGIWGANCVIANDLRRQAGDEEAAKERASLKDDINRSYREIKDYMHSVDTRLTSIETFLNPKKVSPDKTTYVPGY